MRLDDIREHFFIDSKHDAINIDQLNPWYCELTALYYLWKNVSDEVVGLEHYRRYFVNDNKLLSKNDVSQLMQDYDVICKKWVFAEHGETNIYNCWKFGSGIDVLQIFLNCFDEDFLKFVNDKMHTQQYFYQCNMFIGKKQIIDTYCNWLFNTLAKIKFTDIARRPRICGYYAEYFFGLWLQYNNVKIIDAQVNVYDRTLNHFVEK